jgi:hypothetical protein
MGVLHGASINKLDFFGSNISFEVAACSESLRVEPIAEGQQSHFFKVHALLHFGGGSAVEHLFVKPTPDAFPATLWVDLQGVQNHYKRCGTAV